MKTSLLHALLVLRAAALVSTTDLVSSISLSEDLGDEWSALQLHVQKEPKSLDTTGLLQSKDDTQARGDAQDILSIFAEGKSSTGEETVHHVRYFGRSYTISPNPALPLKTVFDDIATKNTWGSKETVSGTGSGLDTTSTVRECLGRWIQKYNISLFVDIPCGDANWQGHIPGLELITYKGYDIASLPLEIARQKNAARPNMSFDQIDLTSQVPPLKPDIIMVRDVLQHLPLQLGMKMLLNAKKSGARLLAVSTFSDGRNVEIPAGSFYENNVHVDPFNLPYLIESCSNYAYPYSGYPTDNLELINLSDWNPSV